MPRSGFVFPAFTVLLAAAFTILLTTPLAAQPCDLSSYRPQPGLTATALPNGGIELSWTGEHADQLRAGFAIRDAQPIVTELAVRQNGGRWISLGRNLTPEFQVTTGKRRLSEQQMAPLRKLGIALTPEVVDREKWFAFWDAP